MDKLYLLSGSSRTGNRFCGKILKGLHHRTMQPFSFCLSIKFKMSEPLPEEKTEGSFAAFRIAPSVFSPFQL